MAEQNAHINYSLADIERYLQGRMNAKEMHLMEKAALQDPFLADAIEGYSDALPGVSQQHLTEIAGALTRQNEPAKVIPLTAKKYSGWRVAASAVLIIGAGLVSWLVMNKNGHVDEHTILAKNESILPVTSDTVKATDEKPAIKKEFSKDLPFPKEPPVVSQPQTETYSLKKQKLSNTTPPKESENLKNSVRGIANLDYGIQLKKEFADSVASDTKKAATADNRDVAKDKNGIVSHAQPTVFARQMNNFKGHVSDNNNQPLGDATVKLNNVDSKVLTDADGNFTVQSRDSVVTASVSSLGYATVNTTLKTNSTNNIVVPEAAESLSEIVVTEMKSKKSKSVAKNTETGAVPEGGWQSFRSYVFKKLNKPATDSTENDTEITGDVDVEFLINTEGKPYSFTVLHSVDETIAQKTIDAIEHGPKWIATGKQRKGKVVLKF